MVPLLESEAERAHAAYVGPVQDTIKMGEQGAQYGLDADGLKSLPPGSVRRDLMWGTADHFAGTLFPNDAIETRGHQSRACRCQTVGWLSSLQHALCFVLCVMCPVHSRGQANGLRRSIGANS